MLILQGYPFAILWVCKELSEEEEHLDPLILYSQEQKSVENNYSPCCL